MARGGKFVNIVSKALNNNPTGETPYQRARREADEADNAYRIAVRRLDRHRLGLEERIEETLKLLQRWESERLRAVKTGMSTFHDQIWNIFSRDLSPLAVSGYCFQSAQGTGSLQ